MTAPAPITIDVMVERMRERIEYWAHAAKHSTQSVIVSRGQEIDRAILAFLESHMDDGK